MFRNAMLSGLLAVGLLMVGCDEDDTTPAASTDDGAMDSGTPDDNGGDDGTIDNDPDEPSDPGDDGPGPMDTIMCGETECMGAFGFLAPCCTPENECGAEVPFLGCTQAPMGGPVECGENMCEGGFGACCVDESTGQCGTVAGFGGECLPPIACGTAECPATDCCFDEANSVCGALEQQGAPGMPAPAEAGAPACLAPAEADPTCPEFTGGGMGGMGEPTPGCCSDGECGVLFGPNCVVIPGGGEPQACGPDAGDAG